MAFPRTLRAAGKSARRGPPPRPESRPVQAKTGATTLMKSVRVPTVLLIGVALALVAVAGHAGDPKQDPPKQEPPKQGPPEQGPPKQGPPKQGPPKQPANEIVQEFPTNGEMETAWKVRWATAEGYGVYIQDAWFKRSPADKWIQVLG